MARTSDADRLVLRAALNSSATARGARRGLSAGSNLAGLRARVDHLEAQVDALTAALRIVVGVQDDSDRT